MMPLAISFAAGSGVGVAIMVGTVWAGGAVTNAILPLSAKPAKISFGKYLVTSLPHVVAGVLISIIGYIAAGLLF